MNILLINHYAGTPELGMEFRPYYMAKEWIKQGHCVLIIGATYSHLRKKQPNAGRTNIDGIDYCWVKTNAYNGNGIGRIFSMFFFVWKLYWYYGSYLKGFSPDVIIASSTYPIDIYPSHKIARHYGAKLIYEVHDLWPLSPMELGGYSKKHPFIRVMQQAENYAYKKADAVVSMLPAAEQHMIDHGLKDGKFFYVPNGIVFSDWNNCRGLSKEHAVLLDEFRDKGNLIVGYAGAHGIANSLQAVIDAVASLVDENIVLVLIGTGQEKEYLMEYVSKREIRNVYFLPPVSKLEIPELLAKIDIFYIGLQKQSLFRFGVSPNKMFDYMMAGKPIIQAIDAGNNLVKEACCGVAVEPDNVIEISKAILSLSKLPVEKLQSMGENGKKFVLKNHTYQILGKRFLDVMTNLINQ